MQTKDQEPTTPDREQHSPAIVEAELQRQQHILMKLAENSLTVAQSIRDNYFRNTARFVSDIRRAIVQAERGERTEAVLQTVDLTEACWSDYQDEVVSFIDGGVGREQISSQVPILLRVGSYTVKVGERCLAEREHFGYYPVILGDIQGGSKDRKDFIDIVRITAELLGGLSALARTPDLGVLMFHGPLVYLVGNYAGHTPFTEADIDLFLSQYAPADGSGEASRISFCASRGSRSTRKWFPTDRTIGRTGRVFEPLAWISFLYRKLIEEARKRLRPPIIAGVVEPRRAAGVRREGASGADISRVAGEGEPGALQQGVWSHRPQLAACGP